MSKQSITVQRAREMSLAEKEQLLNKIEKHAHDREVTYWGCSQAVLDALQRNLGLGNNAAFKAASPFAGGVARMREVCGALVGGVMAIGLAYGRSKFTSGKVALEEPDCVEALVRASKLGERFKQKFGCVRCSDVQLVIHGANFKTHVHYTVEAFTEHARCGDVTGPAARLAAEIILEPTELFAKDINHFLEELGNVREQQKKLGLI